MTFRRTPTLRAAVLAASTAFSLAAIAASPDAAFVQKAAAGGMAEVEMGKLAQDKASADRSSNSERAWSRITARPTTS